MLSFLITMIVIIIISLLFCFIAIKQLISYNKKYHLPENKHTKLFGVLTKEQIAGFYIILVIINALFGIWFIFTI